MKRFYFAALLAVVVALPGNAQTSEWENGFYTLPDAEDVGFMGLSISSDGHYISGTTSLGNMFIADVTTGESKVIEGTSLESCGVSDEGVAVGYLPNSYTPSAITFDLAGNTTNLEDEGTVSKANGITPDGKLIVGSVYTEHTQAAVWVDGERTLLPESTDEWLGFESWGTEAKYASADGSVIVGSIMDIYETYPAMVWVKNLDGSYSAWPICRQCYEPEFGDNPYMIFMPTGISPNGRYIALSLMPMWNFSYIPARFDVETETIEVYTGSEISDIETTGVADDGTIIGYVNGDMAVYGRKGIIWKAGDTPKYMSDVYPESTFTALESTTSSSNSPIQITADGRYIVGYGSTDVATSMFTYVFDTESYSDDYIPGGVSKIESEVSKATTKAVYTLDGKKLHDPLPGINILKRMDGSASKVLVK